MAASKSGFMKDALILFAITLISGVCLGFVYDITKAPIERATIEANNRTYKTGTVTSIDSDVTASSSGSYYKMTITPDSTYVVSNSGDKVDLSNGMSVTARVEYDQLTYFEYAMEALGVLFR